MASNEYQHGLVIGKFYPPHAGHLYLIHTAARWCQQVTVCVLGSSVESIPIETRVKWLRESCVGFKNIRVSGELDDLPVDYASPELWDGHIDLMRVAIDKADQEYASHAVPVDAVFTSEHYGAEMARRFNAAHVCLDRNRSLYPISGTAARFDPVKNWSMLPSPVQAGLTLRIVVVGAESTGTSTLAKAIQTSLIARGEIWARTQYVAEYGREFSANLLALAKAKNPAATAESIHWRSDYFVEIAATQTEKENQAATISGPALICDTDAFATCIWHERYCGEPHPAVEAIAQALPKRTLYLLTHHAGVPFEQDGLRDGEHLRPWMTERFRQKLQTQSAPWLELHGSKEERLGAALAKIDELIQRGWEFAAPFEQLNAE